jgi:hypothetical protein
MFNEGIRTFTAGEALAANRRVKLSSTVGQVEYADKNDDYIGVTEDAAASGAPVAVKLANYPGSIEVEASGVITANSTIYGADDGKVSNSSTGADKFGKALEAASGDGAVIEAVMDKVA